MYYTFILKCKMKEVFSSIRSRAQKTKRHFFYWLASRQQNFYLVVGTPTNRVMLSVDSPPSDRVNSEQCDTHKATSFQVYK